MPDQSTSFLSLPGLNPGANITIKGNLTDPSTLTRWWTAWHLAWQLTTAAGSAPPGEASVAVLYGLGVDLTGNTPTQITEANKTLSIWRTHGYMPLRAIASTKLFRSDGSIISEYFAAFEIDQMILQGTNGQNSVIWLSLNWEGAGWYGVPAAATVQGRLWWSGP